METQSKIWHMWSVRTDVAPPEGYKQIWEYEKGDPTAFGTFIADWAGVERFRAQIGLNLGEVEGELHPAIRAAS